MKALFTLKESGRDPLSPALRQLEHQVERGLVAGLGSAAPTAIVLMLAGIAAGIGPWTPFYAVISVLDGGNMLGTALREVEHGVEPTFFQIQFTTGLATCFILAALSGVVFALGVNRRSLPFLPHYFLGAAHGVLMMCFFYLGVLRVLAAQIDQNAMASSLSEQIGWPALILAHAVHGLALAWLFRSRISTERSPFAHLIAR
jgi:hypothetical protein